MINLNEVLTIHELLIQKFGRTQGVRDSKALDAIINRPKATFDGKDLYPTAIDKAAAVLESTLINHPFIDGNKRAAVMESFLMFNSYGISANVDEQVDFILGVASGKIDRNVFTEWLKNHVVDLS